MMTQRLFPAAPRPIPQVPAAVDLWVSESLHKRFAGSLAEEVPEEWLSLLDAETTPGRA